LKTSPPTRGGFRELSVQGAAKTKQDKIKHSNTKKGSKKREKLQAFRAKKMKKNRG